MGQTKQRYLDYLVKKQGAIGDQIKRLFIDDKPSEITFEEELELMDEPDINYDS